MINITEARTVFQNELDKQAIEGLTSGFLDDNAGDVIYNGGKEIKIPLINMDGLKDYSRTKGYPEGDVTLSYYTYTMEMDRGTGITLDAMDVDETNFVLSAGTVMGEFQRTKVIPEVDAYRYSGIYKKVKAKAAANVNAIALTEENIYKAIQSDIALVKDRCGDSTEVVVIINRLAKGVLDNNNTFTKSISQVEFKKGDVITNIRSIDDCPIIAVPSARMYTEYTFNKGTGDTADKKGGFVKKSSAKLMNYIVMPRKAALAFCKQDKVKIIDPDNNQNADAWFLGYRKYHDILVKESDIEAIRISTEV